MAKKQEVKAFSIENARIGYRNFAGKADKFNAEGDRNFCVFLDPEIAQIAQADGWNIKWPEPREDGEPRDPYLQVSVSYKTIPPKIVMITGRGKTPLDESSVSILDWSDIKTVDLVINPYVWEVRDKTGVKAYVKSMYVVIEEDEFAHKYYDVPEGD